MVEDTFALLARADAVLKAAGIPHISVRINVEKQFMEIVYEDSATAQNRVDGENIIKNFDWNAETAKIAMSRDGQKRALLETDQGKALEAAVIYLLQQIKVAVPGYTVPTQNQMRTAISAIIDSRS